MLAGFSSLLNA